MQRRNARLRREYLHRKSLEVGESVIHEKKQKLRHAIDNGAVIPTELRNESTALKEQIELDDVTATSAPPTHIDDEYGNAGLSDPRILLTTSRAPSRRLVQFAKELKLVIPNAQRLNRGNTVISELIDTSRSAELTDVIILHEHRGEPDGLIVTHLPYGPTAFFGLRNVILRHDLSEKMPTMSEAYPHLVLDNFTSKLGKRVGDILRHLFPVPKADSARVLSFTNRHDCISFRHHTYKTSGRDVELAECGPRFELVLYQIKLGTLEMKEAENEWVLRPYMNTARKRKALSESA